MTNYRALRYAFAAALLAAPVGWIVAGLLTAARADYYLATVTRPAYRSGEYIGEALLAALIAGAAVWLITGARTPQK